MKNTKNPSGSLTGTITEYGYETIANKAVFAGLPSTAAEVREEIGQSGTGKSNSASLGMLALGADGLVIWRREENDSNGKTDAHAG